MKLLCAAQLREARNQNKSKTDGPGEGHFISTASLIIQVKAETRCLGQAPFICADVGIWYSC